VCWGFPALAVILFFLHARIPLHVQAELPAREQPTTSKQQKTPPPDDRRVHSDSPSNSTSTR